VISLDEFLPRVYLHVPACSDPLARQALVDSCIQFCEKSEVLRQDLDPLTVSANVSSYELTPPEESHTFARILSVVIDGTPLHGVFEHDVKNLRPSSEGPKAFHTTRKDNEFRLHLYPTPDKATTATVHAVLRPTRAATEVDDELFERWVDAVVDGAIARITRLPDQPYSDINYSNMMMRSADEKTVRASNEAGYGRIRGNTAVKMRPLA
jgi:hypothetical protein